MSDVNRYRIFIIGAGFSVHAGLPLGSELLELVRRQISQKSGRENKFERDLRWYLEYRKRCDGVLKDGPIDYEKFMSYLDMEHYLGLRGSDTWSEEGNETQLMIRNGIMGVIYERSPSSPTAECVEFCKYLTASDTILTFNYDTLLEDTLDHLGIPYRLFPHRLREVGLMSSIVDSEADAGEVVILKLHGSIDWFDKSPFNNDRELAARYPVPWQSRHPVFRDGTTVRSHQLIDGPREEDDPLQYIYRVDDLSQVISTQFWECCPLILSPSSSKILYANPLKAFWRGLQQAGGLNLGVGVIGYSMPTYDEYARQTLYHIMRNYTEFEPNLELDGHQKGPARILDYVPTGQTDWRIRRNYSFVNWERCELWTRGLNSDAIVWIMQ